MIAVYAPRSLNDPVGCSDSGLTSRDQRCADRHALEAAGRVAYLGQPDQPGSAHPVSPSGVASGTGNYPRQLVRYD